MTHASHHMPILMWKQADPSSPVPITMNYYYEQIIST